MVRALLAGTKTQTRRLSTSPLRRCEVGDRLYVREAAAVASVFTDVVEVRYQASERASHTEFVEQIPVARAIGARTTWPKYRPSIHMPRWASRLTLIVEAVRVEPLQSISEADAEAEGIERIDDPRGVCWRSYETYPDGTPHPHSVVPNRLASISYRELWNSLHTAEGQRWQDNPDVLALTFRVEHRNIDR